MEDWKKKAENLKDKVAGETKEAYGKVTGDKSTEIEGKVQSGVADVKGNAADAKDDLFNKADTARDKVVGETKETYGRVTNDKSTEIEGKIQSGGADIRSNAADLKNDALNRDKDGNFFEDVKESLGTKKPAKDKFGDVIDDVKENADDLGDTIKDKVNDIKNRFKK